MVLHSRVWTRGRIGRNGSHGSTAFEISPDVPFLSGSTLVSPFEATPAE